MEYYAGALYLKAAFSSDPLVGENVGVFSKVVGQQAIYFQPQMVPSLFEPGQLYVDGFFESALIFFQQGDYGRAWQYAVAGMQWLFKFYFLPGLDGQSGCEILVTIAYWMQMENQKTKEAKLLQEVGLDEESTSFPFPSEPIAKPGKLIEFIELCVRTFSLPYLSALLKPGIRLSTKAEHGTGGDSGHPR